jgi:hypothetical protein
MLSSLIQDIYKPQPPRGLNGKGLAHGTFKPPERSVAHQKCRALTGIAAPLSSRGLVQLEGLWCFLPGR